MGGEGACTAHDQARGRSTRTSSSRWFAKPHRASATTQREKAAPQKRGQGPGSVAPTDSAPTHGHTCGACDAGVAQVEPPGQVPQGSCHAVVGRGRGACRGRGERGVCLPPPDSYPCPSLRTGCSARDAAPLRAPRVAARSDLGRLAAAARRGVHVQRPAATSRVPLRPPPPHPREDGVAPRVPLRPRARERQQPREPAHEHRCRLAGARADGLGQRRRRPVVAPVLPPHDGEGAGGGEHY